jgi:hypothetical protein
MIPTAIFLTNKKISCMVMVFLFYRSLDIAAIGMMDPFVIDVIPVDQGVEMVLLRLLVEYFLQLRQFFRVFFGQVVPLIDVIGQIIQFPYIPVEAAVCYGLARFEIKVDIIGMMGCLCLPSIVVNAAGPEYIVMLDKVPGGSSRIVQRISQGCALYAILPDTPDGLRGPKPGQLDSGWQ